uniref:Uncharacterized protein n=1 Tax=Panagrolaimus sp. JU765 TaxID=591449 RepID=A0AC34Q0H2_9BILA
MCYILEGCVKALLPSRILPRKDIRGKIMLITGTGSGIGRLSAIKFGELGARMILWDVNEKLNLETLEILKKKGIDAWAYTVDVSNRTAIYEAADLVKKEVGDVDSLFNNAGIVSGKKIFENDDDLMEKTVGCISVLLTPDVKIDIAVDRSMRVTCFGKFVATLCSNNKSASLSHEHATIYQHEGFVYSVFRSDGVPDKQVVIGDDAVLFTMENLNDTFILSKSGHVSPVARRLCAPLKRDITVRQFYSSCEIGARYLDLCHELVSRAHFSTVDGELQVIVNGIHIVHDRNGNVEILSKPRLVCITPMTGAVQMRSTTLEMAVDVKMPSLLEHVRQLKEALNTTYPHDPRCQTVSNILDEIVRDAGPRLLVQIQKALIHEKIETVRGILEQMGNAAEFGMGLDFIESEACKMVK